ncbi:MAG TPA: hypothetical protein PK014_13905 [Thermoanaerobaculia bacterium]|nr:hypothetical protein [Thermoanaerobaculia bacterium]HUM31158.1 hypothetical protein [Thermoanaerobaculia bacterium]
MRNNREDYLKHIKSRWELWNRAIWEDKKENTILNQIYHLIWNSSIWQLINESRKYADRNADGSIKLNGILHAFIDDNFVSSQLVAVRRLIDGAYPIEGKKGIYSLISVLNDVIANVQYLTRQNIFLIKEIPYYDNEVKKEFQEYIEKKVQEGEKCFAIPGSLYYERTENLHKNLDRLCATNKDKRLPNDTISVDLLNSLLNRLNEVCKKIKNRVDKHIAHNATLESKAEIDPAELEVTLNDLLDAQDHICIVANFIHCFFLNEGELGFLSIIQEKKYSYLDQPFFKKEILQHLDEKWGELRKHYDDLRRMNWADYVSKLELQITNEESN